MQAGPDVVGGTPYIRPTDMTNTSGVSDESQLLRTSLDIAAAYERASLRTGDIVLSIGPSYGKVMIVPKSLEGANLTQGTARLAPGAEALGRWLFWVLQARPSTDFWGAVAAGGTFRALNLGPLGETPITVVPYHEQLRIADFLDDRVARIDQIITARRQQQELLEASVARASFDAVRGEGDEIRRFSGLSWLGAIPRHWPLLTVSTEFQVDLGKMLDEKRQTRDASVPYLRNTNVQWDRIDLSDLKEMDIGTGERERYCVRPGDLLICEGGQPGRSAVWRGEMAPLGFQKALHRARTRGRSRVEWLLECLRVAAHFNVFAVENGQTTIGHLTNEQLRALRFPFPEADEQDRVLHRLHARQDQIRGTGEALGRSTELLQEYKQAVITAAVTGELDVTTAGSGIPG